MKAPTTTHRRAVIGALVLAGTILHLRAYAEPKSPPLETAPAADSTLIWTSTPEIIYEPLLGHPRAPRPPFVPQPEPKVQVRVAIGSHSVRGLASWYCSVAIPICHYAYPPGSMVAAACGKLRVAMGPHWRGRTVRVTSASGSVAVKLVDWCGSSTKLIDLYREPMRRLGGSGVLRVTVSW